MANDTVTKTMTVALALCVVCSLLVSTAAVVLKPTQEVNKTLDRKRNILAAAGLLEDGVSVDEQFSKITTKVVDLRTGKYTTEVSVDTYQQDKAAKDSAQSKELSSDEDVAKIGRLENYSLVYLVEEQGKLDKVILPIRGYGLWSTLYGFIALENDYNTVAGIGFYQHAETPGLGGEIDNPNWKALWPGKKVYKNGDEALALIKGKVNPDHADAAYQIDGLAGATLTSKGVSNLVKFWLGKMGFQPFLNNLSAGEA
ncbi:Na(+)-translocating NADH-quinone reductase subunit C [bacterium]|nr:Na(+)-translocating NADH-quinone reductase subunit C [bacterium]